jgi:hypothetical protein
MLDQAFKPQNMNQRRNTPGRYILFSALNDNWKGGTFYDQEAFADSQLERALDLRYRGFPVAEPGFRGKIKYYFFHSFLPFWVK